MKYPCQNRSRVINKLRCKGKLEHEGEINVTVLILIYVFCQHDKQNSFRCGQVKHGYTAVAWCHQSPSSLTSV